MKCIYDIFTGIEDPRRKGVGWVKYSFRREKKNFEVKKEKSRGEGEEGEGGGVWRWVGVIFQEG